MKRIYYKYNDLECFINGMYNADPINETQHIEEALSLLKNDSAFFSTSLDVLKDWIKTSDHHLSNTSINRRSFIGQSACCYKYGVPEITTRKAWALLNENEKLLANNVADRIIKIYEAKNKRLHFPLGVKVLF